MSISTSNGQRPLRTSSRSRSPHPSDGQPPPVARRRRSRSADDSSSSQTPTCPASAKHLSVRARLPSRTSLSADAARGSRRRRRDKTRSSRRNRRSRERPSRDTSRRFRLCRTRWRDQLPSRTHLNLGARAGSTRRCGDYQGCRRACLPSPFRPRARDSSCIDWVRRKLVIAFER